MCGRDVHISLVDDDALDGMGTASLVLVIGDYDERTLRMDVIAYRFLGTCATQRGGQ
jgi:hypothetical protein